ncbi:MAG: HAD domain-containing protein [Acidobacteria bacterium]|nr:HAD domain-containing protein [Acidobacteriota bacterium]
MSTDTSVRRVIFLDIDGVLQPVSGQKRFRHDLDALREGLAERFRDSLYRRLDKHDLGAVFHDWDQRAVARVRSLCEEQNARIVVSSDWRRRKSREDLKALFRIHGLDDLVADKTGDDAGAPHYRAGEVHHYLAEHAGIDRFVIIDDGYAHEFEQLYADQFVKTLDSLDETDTRRARQILAGGPVTRPNRDAHTRSVELRERWRRARRT